MSHRTGFENDRGFVLMVTLVFLIVMALLVGYGAARVIAHSNHVSRDMDLDQSFLALDGAEAAIRAASGLTDEFYIGLPDGSGGQPAYRFVSYDDDGNPTLDLPTPDPDEASNESIEWQPLGTTPTGAEVSYVAMALPGHLDNYDNDGDGVKDDLGDGTEQNLSEEDFMNLYMASRVMLNGEVVAYRAAQSSTRPGAAVNLLGNAITADFGQVGGTLINGNVSVHGSVLLFGTDPNQAVVDVAWDASGGSFVHNNYNGMPADLLGRVPPLNLVDLDGNGVAESETLDAEFRVKKGTVKIWGTSEIGSNDGIAGIKETMDGVYIFDGDAGNVEVSNGVTPDDKIFSDNGYENAYDYPDEIQFPYYNNDAGEVFVPEKYLTTFDATSWTDPETNTNYPITTGGNRIFHGDISLVSGGTSFYWNASISSTTTMPNGGVVGTAPGTGNMPTLASVRAKALDPNNTEHFIWYDASTKTVVVHGRVPVDGDVKFLSGNGASNKIFNYEGKGTLMAIDLTNDGTGGTAEVDASLKTTGFPGTNAIGLMSQKNFNVGTTQSQRDIMGAFYGQGTVSIAKQTNIVGTILGQNFNIGGQVPNIYAVPALANAFTDLNAMIANNNFTIQVNLGWREFTVNHDV